MRSNIEKPDTIDGASLIILHLLEWVVLGFATYTFSVALGAFLRARTVPPASARLRFAIVVPAHDEAAVVADAVDALRRLDYPRHLFRIVVVADNCTDDTAARARAAGADHVVERNDPARRGKGHALRVGIARAMSGFAPDAVCVFDADNVMTPNFLEAMNARLCAGAEVVQGYLDTKNPDDSWVTKAIAIGYSVAARLFQLSRANLGLSATLGGTGWCIRTTTLAAFPPDPGCLTEDTELQMRLLRAGVRVAWAHEAIAFDEKPITMASSWRQRVRWMQGRSQVARRHALPLLWRAFRCGDLAALDGAVSCLQPSRSVTALLAGALFAAHGAAALLGHAASGAFAVPLAAWAVVLGCHAVFPAAALRAERVPARDALRYAYTALFNAAWLPALVVGLWRSRERTWVATPHTRSIPVSRRLAQPFPRPTGRSEDPC
jgi:hypothetical protein